MTNNEINQQPIQSNSELTQMLELTDKDIQTIIETVFQVVNQ